MPLESNEARALLSELRRGGEPIDVPWPARRVLFQRILREKDPRDLVALMRDVMGRPPQSTSTSYFLGARALLVEALVDSLHEGRDVIELRVDRALAKRGR